MKTEILAVLISEGAKLIGSYWRSRPIIISRTVPDNQEKEDYTAKPPEPANDTSIPDIPEGEIPKGSQIATGCVPCAIGHLGTCSGLLNEAMRFARDEGVTSIEVADRVGMCLDELNSMERVDLRPEMTADIPEWEKELANQVLNASRQTRHLLESLENVDALENAAATTQSIRTQIWRDWLKMRVQNLSPDEQTKIQERVKAKIEELGMSEMEEENE